MGKEFVIFNCVSYIEYKYVKTKWFKYSGQVSKPTICDVYMISWVNITQGFVYGQAEI